MKGMSKGCYYRHLKIQVFLPLPSKHFPLHFCPCTPTRSCHKDKGTLAQLLQVARFPQKKDLKSTLVSHFSST